MERECLISTSRSLAIFSYRHFSLEWYNLWILMLTLDTCSDWMVWDTVKTQNQRILITVNIIKLIPKNLIHLRSTSATVQAFHKTGTWTSNKKEMAHVQISFLTCVSLANSCLCLAVLENPNPLRNKRLIEYFLLAHKPVYWGLVWKLGEKIFHTFSKSCVTMCFG